MKFVGKYKGKDVIKCVLKDGEEKDYKVSEAVGKYASENFKKGDYIATGEGKTEFKDGVITKLVKFEIKPKSNAQKPSSKPYFKSNYSDNKQTSIIRQVIFKVAAELTDDGSLETIKAKYLALKEIFEGELNGGEMKVTEPKPATKHSPTPKCESSVSDDIEEEVFE